jgi:hypothetical protein
VLTMRMLGNNWRGALSRPWAGGGEGLHLHLMNASPHPPPPPLPHPSPAPRSCDHRNLQQARRAALHESHVTSIPGFCGSRRLQ